MSVSGVGSGLNEKGRAKKSYYAFINSLLSALECDVVRDTSSSFHIQFAMMDCNLAL